MSQSEPVFDKKSLEHDGMINSFGGPLGEFTVPIWKQYDKGFERYLLEMVGTDK